MWKSKIKRLEKRVADLENIVPKLYTFIRKSHPVCPCEEFKKCTCRRCKSLECVHHPNTVTESNVQKMVDEVLHI